MGGVSSATGKPQGSENSGQETQSTGTIIFISCYIKSWVESILKSKSHSISVNSLAVEEVSPGAASEGASGRRESPAGVTERAAQPAGEQGHQQQGQHHQQRYQGQNSLSFVALGVLFVSPL